MKTLVLHLATFPKEDTYIAESTLEEILEKSFEEAMGGDDIPKTDGGAEEVEETTAQEAASCDPIPESLDQEMAVTLDYTCYLNKK